MRAFRRGVGGGTILPSPSKPMKTMRLSLLAGVLAVFGSQVLAQTTVTIAATDANAAETLAGQSANPGNIRVTRTGMTTSSLIVYLKSISGTAVRGADFNFGTNVISWIAIPAGSSSVDLAVNVLDDWLTEGSETVRIDLDSETPSGTAPGYVISGSGRATVTIADNEDPLAPLRAILDVVALDANGTETPAGTDPVVFRINRTNNLTPAVEVRFAIGGSAVAGADYTTPPGTITIPAGAAFVDVTLTPIDDAVIELTKSVTFTLLPTDVVGVPLPAEAYAIGGSATASGTIVSDDLPPAPVLTIISPGSNGAAARGQPVTVTFTASAADGYIVSYSVSAGGGTSASGSTNLPATTPPGTPYSGTASVTFNGSAMTYAPLTVWVTNSVGTTTSRTVNVYIFNAPPPPPPPPVLPIINIYPLDAEGVEADASAPNVARFRVTHDFPASATVGFLFAIGGSAKEGIDYTLSSGGGAVASSFLGRWFSFPPGTTEAIITVHPIDDLLIENPETVTMSLYTPPFIGFNEGGPQGFDPGEFGFYYGPNYAATVNVLSDDTTPPPFPLITIAATDAVGTETVDGSDPAVFTVTRNSGPTDVPLTVNYALTIPPKMTIYVTEPRPAMAANGVDFPLLTGAVTIPAGATSADIAIVPNYDLMREVTELLQFTLRPSAAVWPAAGGYVIDEQLVANVNIVDAILPTGTPVVSIRAIDSQAYESAAPSRTAAFVVQRAGSITEAIAVGYTISGSATNGLDYTTLPGTITIPAGSASAQIVIDPIADGVTEAAESVALTLLPPAGNVQPPAYVLAASSTLQNSAGASIRDTYTAPLTRYQRAWLWRHRHFAVQRYLATAAAPAVPLAEAVASLAAPAASAWAVEASTDLVDWIQIGTVEPTEDVDEFVDVNAGDFSTRFYRFREIPPATP